MAVLPRRPVMQAYQIVSGRRFLTRLDELNRNQWLSREELLALQREKLHRLLTYAYGHVPYYQRLFDQTGFRPDDVASRFLALHSPRLSIGLRGSLDADPELPRSVRTMYANARPYYESEGFPGNLVLVIEECGHTFTDTFKQQAFDALMEYFGS